MYRGQKEKKRGRLRWVLIVLAAAALGWGIFGLVYRGPDPVLEIVTERPAIGEPTRVSVRASEPRRGLGIVELQLVQGERAVVIDRFESVHPSPWKPWERGATDATLEGVVGRAQPEWLAEGEATLRVVALGMRGPLRGRREIVVERTVPVLLRPPSLFALSGPVYARQGGTAAILFRPGETASRSGVVAGAAHFRSFALPGATGGERFVLFGVPWDVDDPASIVLYAEDDAGNRSTKRAIDGFRARPPKRDLIRLSDSFFEKVVPAILSQTPELARDGSLLDQYLRINGELREMNRSKLLELSSSTEEKFLWSGPFLQMANSARKANFAEVRTYKYEGRGVDTQTHLGLDLASVARAEVPAPNGGIVTYAGYLGIYGNVVVLDHGYGLSSVNAHLSTIEVEFGQRVAKGEKIGRTGATGLAGGDHLHLGLFIQGTAVDPIEWLDALWIERNLADRLPLDGPRPAAEAAPGA